MTLLLPFVLPLIHVPVSLFDDGWDYMLLQAPKRVVVGDDLKMFARCRPGNPYAIFLDVSLNRRTINGPVPIHLSGVATDLIASGMMAANGEAFHSITTPALPALDGITVYFQAFCADNSISPRIGASTFQPVTFVREQRQPLIKLLTVNKIPTDYNGSEPNEGMLLAPPTGFTVDVFFDPRAQGDIDPSTLVVTSSVALANGTIPAGTNLVQFMTVGPHVASGIVDSRWEFPANTNVTLTADVANTVGSAAPTETYPFRVERFSTRTQPFERRQLWHLDFDTHDLDSSGVLDYREDLVLFGLGNDATDQAGPAAIVAQWSKESIQLQLRANFRVNQPGGVNVNFRLNSPPSVHSRICIGGRNAFPPDQLPPGAQETTGAAFLNPRNQRNNIINCFGVVGVHPRSIYFLFRNVPAFVTVFGPLQNNPVGNDPDDVIVTAPGFDPDTGTARQRARYQEIQNGVTAFANATSFILTQETCHSMGLVEGGILPTGQLSSEQFGASTTAHTEDGLGNFMSGNNSTPAPAQPQNLAMIWNHFQSGRAHFTPFNWAYLREQVIHQ